MDPLIFELIPAKQAVGDILAKIPMVKFQPGTLRLIEKKGNLPNEDVIMALA